MLDLIIPGFIVAFLNVFLMYNLFKSKVAWFEVIPPVISSIFIGVIMKLIVSFSMTTDYEYHGGYAVRIENQKAWTEWYEVDVDDYCTDSNGKRYVCGSHKETRYTYHPETWMLKDSNGYPVYIDSSNYYQIKNYWKLNETIDPGHSDDYHHYSGDGRLFYCVWNSDMNTIVPVTTEWRYTNKIQAADQSLFHFREVSKADIDFFQLYDLPKIYSFYKMNYISGTAPDAYLANKELEIQNALLGRSKQVQMRILLFQNKTVDAALMQEAYWQGGNKNEFNLCIGIDGNNNVQWAKVFSWSEEELLKIKVRDYVQQMGKLDLVKTVDFMAKSVQSDFVRKQFKDFDYLELKIPFWAHVTTFILILIVTLMFDYYAITNDVNHDDLISDYFGNSSSRFRWRNYR